MADAREFGDFLIALGGNMPSDDVSGARSPADTLRAALAALEAEEGVSLTAVSHFYATPCFPAGAGPDYVNAAARLASRLAPAGMLDLLHRIEAEFGRMRTQRWGQRVLDLDLIACGDTVLPDSATYRRWRDLPLDAQMNCAPETLILPHPRLEDRAFVLVPLADVAPEWCHPVTGRSTAQMLADLPPDSRAEVVRLP
ncbi:2-amino-4-hydroxy-6-hydroxymethyldihydropteridine diphosphokinase [Roseovarius nanhaiticus]|uniref:2-amino-4-hydroxy-6- hydroxymethyldihydropteridine diphosphokinase n=1 Tax=Roseovarius nanhaiticus TaxID=573024 RepID=UPI0024932B20|nr:2-amino-4-hydroxy-6-hydroxymethyldihydropteridine diphosphokinase [Roseovarius nanhaiticus]